MRQYYYYKSFRKTIIQFLDIFNDIQVARYAPDGVTVSKYITIPVKLAVKEKAWYWLNERKDDQMLPMINGWISAIDYAADRKVNSGYQISSVTNVDTGLVSRYLLPVPYNLTFTLNIWSLHMVDVDQILEQILPWFDPFIYVKMNIPELGCAYDIKVIFQSCTPEVSLEMADEDYRVINYTIDFKVETYLFKPISDSAMIKEIITSYYTNEDVFESRSFSSTTVSASPSGGIRNLIIGWKDGDGNTVTKMEEFGP